MRNRITKIDCLILFKRESLIPKPPKNLDNKIKRLFHVKNHKEDFDKLIKDVQEVYGVLSMVNPL